ncbi:hypothetical protein Ahy_A09g043380 [Arachis hypogaea]|uniref:FAR1 domain-containing protein n=1 Tax=Arachis hypogaea TaxID=3818 RepID=A0A445BI56_ARAHY|nr:hypothetical protein Ahy_A09g043380 [Arachis hypogaea]
MKWISNLNLMNSLRCGSIPVNCSSSDESVAFYIRLLSVNQEYLGVKWESLGSLCDVDEHFVPKVGMNFKTLEDATKFYKNYSKAAGFSTRVRSTNKKDNEIKNQLITCM